MLTKRLVPLALIAAAGAIALSACAGQTTVGAAPAAQAPASPATGADVPASDTGLALLSGTAKSNDAPQGTGDWAMKNGGTPDEQTAPIAARWVQLTASKAGDLDPVVVNGARLTLYRFDNDTANPSKSNCNDDCAKKWPPVTVQKGGKIFIAGIKAKDVGVVKRDDGRLQVTVKGWPAYRFAKDTKPGDTIGQGVGGTWFGLRPDGGKAGVDAGSAGDDNGADGPAATSAVLFDDKNFSDNGASQGVAGNGCQDVARPGVTSSIAAQGHLKLWTGKGCTGKSKVIDGDVLDLGKIGFDDRIQSVKLG